MFSTVCQVAGCASFQRAPSSMSAGLVDPFLKPLTSSGEAGSAPMMFVGSLTVLLGVVTIFWKKKVLTGLSMIGTGFMIGMLAIWLRDYSLHLALLSFSCSVGFGVWLIVDSSFRRRLLNHAKILASEGRRHEARILEKEAHDAPLD